MHEIWVFSKTEAGKSYKKGWFVFHDANNNSAIGSGETVIERAPPLTGDLRLTGGPNVTSYVSFVPTGAAFQSGTLTLCRQSASGGEAREITLHVVGRPRIQKTTVTTCPV